MSNVQDKSGLLQQAVDLDLPNANKKSHDSSVNKNKKKYEKKPKCTNTKEQGKFVELPGAEMGKVVVRFPPEASGYLHIGHAKAALLNQHYQLAFNGRLVMRFDDTNPAKEKENFEKVILEDVDMLKIKPDAFTYTSDYFDTMLVMCENLLKAGHAFVDDTDGEKMRMEREQRIESINRNNSIEKNLELWHQMKLGSVIGQMCCVRAKIDMASVNGCMRDPTIYRCKPELHPRTADKYKVYPTYDFACPIVDSLEGITHCLRTTEYTDRDQQYYWFCDTLKLGQRENETRPFVWSYSRLNMTNTVLSKRKLTWFVEQGLVDGWDDPRMPTVRGVFRRGMQLEALKQFIISQGSSRTVTAMQWDKIWSLNRSIIDPVAPRHTALLRANIFNENIFSRDTVEVLVENVEKPYKLNNVPKHPKNSQLGFKDCVWAAPKILIDYSDAELLDVGRRATFINWGNLLINKIERNPDNKKIEKVFAVTDLENTDFKSTFKITWLPNIKSLDSNEILPSLIPVVCVYFEHLITKPVLAKDDDFKQFITEKSRWELQMWGDFELKDLKKSEIIQLQRRGFFICDSSYQPYSIHTGKETPLVLFHIPDGHSKTEIPITSIAAYIKNTAKEIKKNDKIQSVDKIIPKINEQENIIQNMKAAIDEAVNTLLTLKGEYKSITGKDFPQGGIPTPTSSDQSNLKPSSQSVDEIIKKINEQGDNVRTMKSKGASKADIGEAVKVLLALKGEYKNLTGKDFPQGGIPTPTSSDQSNLKPSSQSVDEIIKKINEQGDNVRTMKSKGASKADIGEAVKVLLALKGEYKNLTGKDFPQGGIPTPTSSDQSNLKPSSQSVDEIITKINEQGDNVRTMKSKGASKADIGEAVKTLLALKGEYKNITGKDFPQGGIPTPTSSDQSNLKPSSQSVDEIITKINEQGDNVRTMKSKGASKADIGEAVKVLLALKGEYKNLTGKDFPQGGIPTPTSSDQSNLKPSSQSVDEIITKINEQGDNVRTMKSKGASKADIGEAVKVLLALKGEYKNLTGKDFPQGGIPTPTSSDQSNLKPSSQSVDEIITKINEQGDNVRTMKSKGASKADIGEAVKVLLALKGEYKNLTGKDFPQGGIPTPTSSDQSNLKPSSQSVDEIITKINEQGDNVRTMKSKGASKADIGEAVKTLLALKGEYKNITGKDFPQGGIPTPTSSDQSNLKPSSQSVDEIIKKINEQGDNVRTMKSKGASKADIGEAVKTLLALKGEYKNITGKDFPQGGIPTPKSSDQSNSKPSSQSVDEIIPKINEQGDSVCSKKSNGAPKVKKSKKKENIVVVDTPKTTDSSQTKKITKLGLEVPKVAENLGDWYSQVLVKSEMIEYYDVSGCYILRPWAYKIWSLLQEWFDARIKSDPLNVENCYFPIFVSKGALEKEKEHIADFAPEVAWVTKSGETDLAEPIAIRPTSETVMYPAFAKWIQSYRDLPLKLNQWNNVVRWEFKHPQPFLRTREFLWQEGHHAYATQEEAERDVLIILDYYEYVYKNMLAVPVIKGRKTEKEKFAGGDFTATCEAYVAASGRAIQGATSHYLGTNFARMFNVEYEHPITHEQLFAHQISYGMTTRTIGVMVMVHGDNRGLVLPPNVATIQVIIVLCGVGASTSEDVKQKLTRTCLEICSRLKGDNISKDIEAKSSHNLHKPFIRAHTDLRDNYSPGWKFNHWELKGVPLRLEIGPKDLDRGQITAVRRDTGEKLTIPLDVYDGDKQNVQDPLVNKIDKLLIQIQQDMLAKAEQEMKNNIIICRKWSDCAINLAKKCLLLVPFCGQPACEDNIKRDTARDDGTAEIGASTMGAKSLCVPFEQPSGDEKLKPDDQCIHPECGQPAGFFTLFGRSY